MYDFPKEQKIHTYKVRKKPLTAATQHQPLSVEKIPLRKHAYSNIFRILPQKMKTFRTQILVVFIFLLKT